jgi:hypothetical protein
METIPIVQRDSILLNFDPGFDADFGEDRNGYPRANSSIQNVNNTAGGPGNLVGIVDILRD